MSAIALEALTVRLGDHTAVDGVSFGVEPGEWVALIGPNGAGKSTLLRAVAGLVSSQGEVLLDGVPARSLSRRQRAQRVALVPQEPETPPWLTVGEYVLLGRTPHLGGLAREGAADEEAAARALGRLDLWGLRERTLGTLSGGERQRAVVARALAQEAGVVLLDEPTTALDIGHQQRALELLDDLRADHGLTLVAAIHDLTLAAQYADRVVLLDAGRVVADGRPAAVLTEERVARHFAAAVRVVRDDELLAVVPLRAGR